MRAAEIMARIVAALKRVGTEETAAAEGVEQARRDYEALTRRQDQQFLQLAQRRLKALLTAPADARMSEAERKAIAIYGEYRKVASALQANLAQAEDQLRRALAEQKESAERLASLERESATRREATRRRLSALAEWRALFAKEEELSGKVMSAAAHLAESERNRDELSRRYQADALFMYLNRRHYGTPQYPGGWFSRWGDGLVARLIRYERARRNYEMLHTLPVELGRRLKEMREEQARFKSGMEGRFREELERDGGGAVETMCEAERTRRERLKSKVQSCEAPVAETKSRVKALLEKGLPKGSQAALSTLVEMLKRKNPRPLAGAGPSADEAQFLRELEDLRRSRRGADGSLIARRAALAKVRRTRQELQRVQKVVKQSVVVGGLLVFDDEVGDLIDGIADGSHTAFEVMELLEDAGYDETAAEDDPDAVGDAEDLGDAGFVEDDGFDADEGDGFGGADYETGGGFGGDDFETGGGFGGDDFDIDDGFETGGGFGGDDGGE